MIGVFTSLLTCWHLLNEQFDAIIGLQIDHHRLHVQSVNAIALFFLCLILQSKNPWVSAVLNLTANTSCQM